MFYLNIIFRADSYYIVMLDLHIESDCLLGEEFPVKSSISSGERKCAAGYAHRAAIPPLPLSGLCTAQYARTEVKPTWVRTHLFQVR